MSLKSISALCLFRASSPSAACLSSSACLSMEFSSRFFFSKRRDRGGVGGPSNSVSPSDSTGCKAGLGAGSEAAWDAAWEIDMKVNWEVA
ncbi:hypothetical protein EV426DRAFT_582177 [Tirmania nivea]|nr:hypothetical protein EV426DRAFT_582177 [Tirmania nivea]